MLYQFNNIALLSIMGMIFHMGSYANTTKASVNSNNNTLLTSTIEDGKVRVDSRGAQQKRGGLLNPPARPIVEDFDFNFFGDLLLWQAHEGGLGIAVKNKATNFTSATGYNNLQNSHVKHLNFDYDLGFRIGVDADTTYDGWNMSLTWLRFNTNAHVQTHAYGNKELFASRLNPQIIPFLTANGVSPTPVAVYEEASAHWNALLNQLELDLGREFFVSRRVTLRPHFGLRTTWLQQKLNTNYNDGIVVTDASLMPDVSQREKNAWWGLGVQGGVDTTWGLGGGVSIYGNIAAAIEYGFQQVRTNVAVTGFESNFERNKDSFRTSRSILDIQLGLRWDRSFSNDSYNFGLHAGWENHIYYSQNQFHTDLNLGQFVANQGDLTYQGWTVGAHLAF